MTKSVQINVSMSNPFSCHTFLYVGCKQMNLQKKKWHGIFVNAITCQIQGGPSTLSIYKKKKKEKITGDIRYCIGLQMSKSSAQFD